MLAQLAFRYERISAMFHASFTQHGQVMRSQDDDGELGEMLVKLQCSFQTVHPRHLKVHQDHVGGRACDGAKSLLTTLRGGHDFKNRIAFKKGTKRMQERGRIVHRQHAPMLRFYLRHFGPASR